MSWKSFVHFGRRALEEGDFSEAETLLRTAVEKAESVGRPHWRLSTSLNNLAEVYRRQRRFAEAEPLYLRAIEIDQRLLREDSRARSVPIRDSGISLSYGDPASDLASGLNNLALLYDAQGRFEEAAFYFEQAIGAAESPLLLRNYAVTLRHLGLHGRADDADAHADALDSKSAR